MPWFSDPQRDSRDDIRATQQALKYAGDPRSQAEVDYATHLYRVRAALATPRHVLGAGFLVGVAGAGALLLALGVGSFLIVAAFGSAVPAWGPAGPFVVRGPDDSGSSGGSLLDILLPLVTTVAVLGVAGAGIALVTRNRWRRAGVLDTYIDLAPRQSYLLQTVAVWVGVGALMVLAVRWQGDEEMVTGAVVMLTFAGIPLLALLFSAMFPSLYKWLLPRVSPVDAAAFARPVIEREVALRIKSDRELYGRGVQRHSIDPRDRWADEVLARLNASSAARRRR